MSDGFLVAVASGHVAGASVVCDKPTGTKDIPSIITDVTPLLEWAFAKPQGSFCVTIRDADDTVIYTSGWLASSIQSHQTA